MNDAGRRAGPGFGAGGGSEHIVTIARADAEEVRPHASAFAEAVLAGARGLATRGPGALAFSSEEVEEIHRALHAALLRAVEGPARVAIEARSGAPVDAFLDRVVRGWLRAGPGFAEILAADPRAAPGFVFDVLRAELLEIGLDLDFQPEQPGEPGSRGHRVYRPMSPHRPLALFLGGLWIGVSGGTLLRLGGWAGAGMIVLALGTALGGLAAVRQRRRPPSFGCSECASDLEEDATRCARCGLWIVGEAPGDEDSLASGPFEAGREDESPGP